MESEEPPTEGQEAPRAPFSEKIDSISRAVSSVEAPVTSRLDSRELWDADGMPVVGVLTQHLTREGRLHKADAIALLEKARALFTAEANVVEVPVPVTVCGDVHGQFYDLLKLLRVGGNPADTNYLFLGDYVDRGYFSIETVLLLYAYKILYPKTFLMLRGNHECRHLTEYFTFREECLHKYDVDVYDACMLSFDALPLAAVVNRQFFCVHGGLSPDIDDLDDILRLNRFVETPSRGPMCDLLWTDPMEDYGPDMQQMFEFNSNRGCSYCYGYGAVVDFLTANDFLCVLRGHEAQDDGYLMYEKSDSTGFPTVITLFSAPNYTGTHGNRAAIMKYDGATMNIRQFNESPHPYRLPNFMNAITWSLPFLSEKVADILFAMARLCEDDEESMEVETTEHRQVVKRRILAASRLMSMMSTLRSERETILKLKEITPGNRIPEGLLAQGPDAVRKAMGNFLQSRELDKVNEMWPEAAENKTDLEAEKADADRHILQSAAMRRMESRGNLVRRTSQSDVHIITEESSIPPPNEVK